MEEPHFNLRLNRPGPIFSSGDFERHDAVVNNTVFGREALEELEADIAPLRMDAKSWQNDRSDSPKLGQSSVVRNGYGPAKKQRKAGMDTYNAAKDATIPGAQFQ